MNFYSNSICHFLKCVQGVVAASMRDWSKYHVPMFMTKMDNLGLSPK